MGLGFDINVRFSPTGISFKSSQKMDKKQTLEILSVAILELISQQSENDLVFVSDSLKNNCDAYDPDLTKSYANSFINYKKDINE